MVPVFLSFDRYLVNPLNSYGFKLPLQCLQHPSQQKKRKSALLVLANPPLLYPFYKATDRFPLALLAEEQGPMCDCEEEQHVLRLLPMRRVNGLRSEVPA